MFNLISCTNMTQLSDFAQCAKEVAQKCTDTDAKVAALSCITTALALYIIRKDLLPAALPDANVELGLAEVPQFPWAFQVNRNDFSGLEAVTTKVFECLLLFLSNTDIDRLATISKKTYQNIAASIGPVLRTKLISDLNGPLSKLLEKSEPAPRNETRRIVHRQNGQVVLHEFIKDPFYFETLADALWFLDPMTAFGYGRQFADFMDEKLSASDVEDFPRLLQIKEQNASDEDLIQKALEEAGKAENKDRYMNAARFLAALIPADTLTGEHQRDNPSDFFKGAIIHFHNVHVAGKNSEHPIEQSQIYHLSIQALQGDLTKEGFAGQFENAMQHDLELFGGILEGFNDEIKDGIQLFFMLLLEDQEGISQLCQKGQLGIDESNAAFLAIFVTIFDRQGKRKLADQLANLLQSLPPANRSFGPFLSDERFAEHFEARTRDLDFSKGINKRLHTLLIEGASRIKDQSVIDNLIRKWTPWNEVPILSRNLFFKFMSHHPNNERFAECFRASTRNLDFNRDYNQDFQGFLLEGAWRLRGQDVLDNLMTEWIEDGAPLSTINHKPILKLLIHCSNQFWSNPDHVKEIVEAVNSFRPTPYQSYNDVPLHLAIRIRALTALLPQEEREALTEELNRSIPPFE